MRAPTGSQWSSMRSGVTCALFGWLNTRCAAACWIICSGFITHAGRLVRRTTCEEVLKDTYRRNAPISAVQVTRDSLHPKILSNMKYNKWANAHGFRNLTVTAKGSSHRIHFGESVNFYQCQLGCWWCLLGFCLHFRSFWNRTPYCCFKQRTY